MDSPKKRIYVLTAATPRYEVHKRCCIDIVKKLSKDYDVHVNINFDVPPMLIDRQDEIKLTIKDLKKYATVNSFVNIKNPCFSAAWFKTFSMIEEVDVNDIFFWLEDDWSLINEFKFKNSIPLCPKFDALCFVNLDPSGPPYIFSLKFYYAILNYVTHFDFRSNLYGVDPERIMRKTYQKECKSGNEIIKVKQCGVRESGNIKNALAEGVVFIDEGRTWRDNMRIKKWTNKADTNEKTWT